MSNWIIGFLILFGCAGIAVLVWLWATRAPEDHVLDEIEEQFNRDKKEALETRAEKIRQIESNARLLARNEERRFRLEVSKIEERRKARVKDDSTDNSLADIERFRRLGVGATDEDTEE